MRASEAIFQLFDKLGYQVCGTTGGAEFTEYMPVEGHEKSQLMAEIDKRINKWQTEDK